MRVNVVCKNWQEDRILPRFARYLRDGNGWSLTEEPDPTADVVYLAGYFEAQTLKREVWERPVAALFTHREETPVGNEKAKLFDSVAERVQLRVTMCRLYGKGLERHGLTVQPPLPVERERFTIRKPSQGRETLRGRGIRAGFSGYTYANRRKGEDLVGAVLASKAGRCAEWRASGRGWPVPTKRYGWAEMPSFYQSLDVLVCTSRVEGGPMPPLEALACGVSVVVPRGVGLLDELPDTPGIHRYARGDAAELSKAFAEAARMRPEVDRARLRAVTEPYTVEAWCKAHREAFVEAFEVSGGIAEAGEKAKKRMSEKARGGEKPEPVERGTGSKRGIYCVAFGEPARKSALRMMRSAKAHMPEIPIALCAASKIGPEDVLIVEPDSDIGGRRNKLRAYELAPAEWESTLYLDADTEVVGDIRLYFQLIEDGWEFVICKDPHLMDTMHAFKRPNNTTELRATEAELSTLHTLQYNGGVWAFGRSERIAAFFERWQTEWERYAQRDQGALIRAMYADPLKVYLLGNEWNTFPKYTRGVTTAGLMHYPGDARRWDGLIAGRIDSPQAWEAVKRFEARQ